MVDFKSYFQMLKKAKLKPPVSLHCEYSMGGAEKGERSITTDKKFVFELNEEGSDHHSKIMA
jgi:L-ribulose-5-phosphate 3-epimerase